MKSYAFTHTQAGIERRLRERALRLPIIEPQKAEPPLAASPVANVVLPFRKPAVAPPPAINLAKEISRAKHLAFLASIRISTAPMPILLLINRVAAWHGFTCEEMIQQCRKHDRVDARADCVAAVKKAYPKMSLPRMGQLFGGRDHTTILHYLRKRGM
jgi:hypothetical protein